MGVLQECRICRVDGSGCFNGHAWVGPGGLFDAEWSEEGKRKRSSFQANGRPVGIFNRYILSFA